MASHSQPILQPFVGNLGVLWVGYCCRNQSVQHRKPTWNVEIYR